MTVDSKRALAKEYARAGLTMAGEVTPPAVPRLLNAAANFIETGRRMRQWGLEIPRRRNERFEVLATAAGELATEMPLYLEFGVYRGETIRFMAAAVSSDSAGLVGFDSFEGLPEDWTPDALRGHFSTSGNAPDIADPRVSFVRGWFADTLRDYELPRHDRLLVNIDCDLYASAKTVLAHLTPAIGVGDLLYFDEFHDRLNEGRAFAEHLSASGYTYEVLAATRSLSQILLRRTE